MDPRDDASARLAPDGTQVALGSLGGDIALWTPSSGDIEWEIEGTADPAAGIDGAPAMPFSSNGDRLVVAGADRSDDPQAPSTDLIRELDPSTGLDGRQFEWPLGNEKFRSLNWLDTTETTVLTSGEHNDVQTFDLTNGTHEVRSEIGTFDASAALPKLGLIIVESGRGLDVHSIDGSGPLLSRIPLHAQQQQAWETGTAVFAAVDPTGDLVLSGVATPRDITPSLIIDRTVPAAAWEPYLTSDGTQPLFAFGGPNYIATTGGDLGLTFTGWDGAPLGGPIGEGLIASLVAVSPRGDRAILSAGGDDILLDVGSGQEIVRLGSSDNLELCCPLPAFSSDGALISRPDRRGGTELYEADSGAPLDFDHDAEAKLFGPVGTWFATVDELGTVHLRDQQSGQAIGEPLVGHRGVVQWMLPTLDGDRIATIGFDQTARAWDLETMNQVGRAIDADPTGFSSWSADGRFLAVGSPPDDSIGSIGTIDVWDFDADSWPDLACQIVGRNLTEAEWEQFGPRTIERRATCG